MEKEMTPGFIEVLSKLIDLLIYLRIDLESI